MKDRHRNWLRCTPDNTGTERFVGFRRVIYSRLYPMRMDIHAGSRVPFDCAQRRSRI